MPGRLVSINVSPPLSFCYFHISQPCDHAYLSDNLKPSEIYLACFSLKGEAGAVRGKAFHSEDRLDFTRGGWGGSQVGIILK